MFATESAYFAQFSGWDASDDPKPHVWVQKPISPFGKPKPKLDESELPRLDKDGDVIVREKPADAGDPKYKWGGDAWKLTRVRTQGWRKGGVVTSYTAFTSDNRKFILWAEDIKAIKMAGYDVREWSGWNAGGGFHEIAIYIIDHYDEATVTEGRIGIVLKPVVDIAKTL